MTSNIESTEPKRGRGRPPIIKLDDVQKVARLMAKGLSEEQSCLRVGINHSSYRTARHRRPDFETAHKAAMAAFLDESLDVIAKGTKGWQGRAWILERRHSDQFRKNTGVEVSGFLASHITVDVLIRKPLAQWSAKEVEASVGMWRLLRAWDAIQLKALTDAYNFVFGPDSNRWSDERLHWIMEIERRCDELNGVQSDPLLLEMLRTREPTREPKALIPNTSRAMEESPSTEEAPIFALG